MSTVLRNFVRLWTPITATWDTATARVQIKPPDIGNTEQRQRNQTMHRTRAGVQQVYDRGINFNDVLHLHFQALTDVERSNLVSFMDHVQWGSTKLVYEDMYSATRYVRFTSQQSMPQVKYADTGLNNQSLANGSYLLWDFDLELVNITDNFAELSEVDPVPTSALALHLLDFNDPHDPETVVLVNIADGAKVIEGFKTRDWKAITWLITAEKSAQRAFFVVSCEHDGFATTDATTTDVPRIEQLNDLGGMATNITFTVDLNGAGLAQVMRLNTATALDGVTITCRRRKLT